MTIPFNTSPKHCILGFFFVSLFLHTELAANAVVTGRMKNAAAGDRIELYVPHYYIDNLTSDYKTTLDANGGFSFDAIVPEPQIAFLIFGEEQLPIYLEPNDSLLIRADMFQFPVVVAFGGKSGTNNRILKEMMPQRIADFNEFNNVRFKIGEWWFGLESTMNERMLEMNPSDFKAWMDNWKLSAFARMDEQIALSPEAVTGTFREWIEAEIVYTWAYNLLMYGQVYRNRYQIEESFFEFLYEAPTVCRMIGSDAYRQFLLVLMARQQAKKADPDNFYAGQFRAAGQLLEGKPLSWFQSEIIRMAFSSDRLQEILPAYQQYLKENHYQEFEAKITPLYERTSRFIPGTMAPDFEGKDFYTGQIVSISTLQGKVIYLNFWASWCGACLKKMEIFEGYANELENAGVVIVNISIDEHKNAWQEQLIATRIAGMHLLASDYPAYGLVQNYGVQAVPQYFLIAGNGTIAQKPYSHQPDDIRKRLLELAR